MPKSLLGWAVLIVVVVLIFKHPTSAGHAVATAADSIGAFFGSL